jgi:hypothetical protein
VFSQNFFDAGWRVICMVVCMGFAGYHQLFSLSLGLNRDLFLLYSETGQISFVAGFFPFGLRLGLRVQQLLVLLSGLEGWLAGVWRPTLRLSTGTSAHYRLSLVAFLSHAHTGTILLDWYLMKDLHPHFRLHNIIYASRVKM